MAEFGDVYADMDRGKARLEAAVQKIAQRGYKERARKLLGDALVADVQRQKAAVPS